MEIERNARELLKIREFGNKWNKEQRERNRNYAEILIEELKRSSNK